MSLVEESFLPNQRRLAKATDALTKLRRLFLEGEVTEETYRADKTITRRKS